VTNLLVMKARAMPWMWDAIGTVGAKVSIRSRVRAIASEQNCVLSG